MNNLALKWHDIDVSFVKEKDEVMVNLTDMAKGFPKKDLSHIMNSKEMREYIQAIKRRYEARKSEIQFCVSLNEDQKSETEIYGLPENQSLTDGETKTQICVSPENQSLTDGETKTEIYGLPENQSLTDGETKTQNCISPENQSLTDGETEIQNCISPDFQPVRVVKGGSVGEQGTWAIRPIAIRVAQKLNPDFAVWVDEMGLELLTKGKVELSTTNIEEMHLGHAVSESEDDMYIADVAKLLKTTQGAPIGRNRLFKFLREGKYLGKKDVPYQKYMDKFTQTLVRCSDGKLRLVTKLKTSSIGWLMSQWNKRNLVLRCHIGDMEELF